jgi:predicted ferric reductase
MTTRTSRGPVAPAQAVTFPFSRATHRPAGGGPARRPRALGALTHVAITALIAIVWLVVGPVDGPFQNHVAELLGVESIWLMSSSVLVLTRSARIDRSFGGVDGTLLWHRLAGAVGIGLGMIHPALFVEGGEGESSALAHLIGPLTVLAVVLVAWAFMTPTSRAASWQGPIGWLARRGYDSWRTLHGVLAGFLVVAMAHGVADSASLQENPALLTLYAGVCAVGLYALIERMLVARLKVRDVAGTVVAVERFGESTAVITIAPEHPVSHKEGQFIELGVPVSGERPHPFTIISAPDSPHVQVAVRALGVGTTRIVKGATVGDRVSLSRARGLLRHQDAGRRQVWVAGGIGIAPFISWVRSQGEHYSGHHVDLIWSNRGFDTEPFVHELVAAAQHSTWLTVHLHDTARSSRLTADDLVTAGGGKAEAITVLACGSPAMISALGAGLIAAGLPRERLHTEAFAYR